MTPPTRKNPYVGPRAFETGEELFGRDRETRELLDLLIAKRIVLLHSPSGAGKSSLIQAALIPRLKQERFQVLRIIRVNHPLPADLQASDFNRYLFSALLSLEGGLGLPDDQRLPPDRLAGLSLSDYLEKRATADDASESLVLIFDQFEEILTLDPTDNAAKAAFFAQVGAALRDRSRWALFAIREDYLAAFDPYVRPVPTRLSNTLRLDLLGVDAARQAIQLPAVKSRVDFTDRAVNQLVDNLRRVRVQQPDGTIKEQPGPYVEPVQLQVVCYRMWDHLPESAAQITEDDIEAVGNVDDALAGYYADRVAAVAHDIGVKERAIRDWFGKHLITEQGLRGQVLLGPERSEGLDNRAIALLERAHLIRAEKRSGATWFELAHDRLIGPVRHNNEVWIEANLSPMQRQAAIWESEKQPDHLLLRDRAFVDAEQWVTGHADELTDTERKFLEESRKARTEELEERKRAEQALRLEAERRRAEEHAETARRLRVRNRIITAVGALALLVAVVAFYFAAQAQAREREAKQAEATAQAAHGDAEARRKEAEDLSEQLDEQKRVATSRWLSALAGSRPPALAMLLSLEANGEKDTVESRASLLEGLVRNSHVLAFLRDRSGYSAEDSLVFSPDGQKLVDAGGYTGILIWQPDTATGRWESQPISSIGSLSGVVFSPDGNMLAGSEQFGGIIVWNQQTGIFISLQPSQPLGSDSSLAFNPGGKTLAVSEYESIVLWDIPSSQPLDPPLTLTETVVTRMSFAPDGNTLAAGYDNGAVILWDVASRQPIDLPFAGHDAPITFLKFAQESLAQEAFLASVDSEGVFIAWDVSSGQPLGQPEQTLQTNVVSDYSSDVQKVAFGKDDGTVIVWDILNGTGQALTGHAHEVTSLAFSPDGALLASSSEDGTVILWRVTGSALADPPLQAHSDPIAGVAFSAADGGQTFISAAGEEIVLWDRASRQPQGQPLTATVEALVDFSPASVAFSPDGSTIAAGSHEGPILLWNRETGATDQFLQDGSSWSLAFSPDGKTVATGDDRFIRLRDIATGRAITLTGHDDTVTTIALSPDGTILASGSADDSIILWDVEKRQPLDDPLTGHTDDVYSVAFSPDGKILASGSADNSIILWDMARRQPLGEPLTGHTGAVQSLAFNPDGGTLLASGSADGRIILWDVTSRQPLGEPLIGHGGVVYSVAFSPDGTILASGGDDHTVRVWDMASRQQRGEPLEGHIDVVYDVAFSPDGTELASAGGDKTILVWDAANGTIIDELRSQIMEEVAHTVSSIALNSAGTLLASGGTDGTIVRWDLEKRQPIGEPLTAHSSAINSLTSSPDGNTLATSGLDGRLILWDAISGQLRTDLTEAQKVPASPHAVVFSPDGRRLAVGYDNGTVMLWDVAFGEPSGGPLASLYSPVSSLAFSPDGSILAAGSTNSVITWWDVGSPLGELIRNLPQRVLGLSRPITTTEFVSGTANSLAFSPEGKMLAAGLTDNTVVLWDVATGQRLGVLTGHATPVTHIAFSPDGEALVSGSEDGTLILWAVSLDAWKSRACGLAARNLTWAEWEQYHPDEDYRETCENNFVDFADVSYGYLSRAQKYALGDVERASDALDAAVEWSRQANDSDLARSICDFGLQNGYEDNVVPACRRAIELAIQADDYDAAYQACKLGTLYQNQIEADVTPACQRAIELAFDEVDRGAVYALTGDKDKAEAEYKKAVQDALDTEDAGSNNYVCWFGSLDGFAEIVLPACERAVELATESDIGSFRDSRGLARALTSNYEGAVEDFQYFVDWLAAGNGWFDEFTRAQYIQERESFIAALRDRKNPFDEETLALLRNE